LNPFTIDYLDLTLRLLIALVLGGAIGYERERNNRPAGFRTHILVCVGSALLMLISMYGFSAFADQPRVSLDPSRLAAQVITSIGFLGAGTILHKGFNVTGLTTAASLWVASAIGLAVGAGFYYGAILTTAIMLLSLYILSLAEDRFFSDKRLYVLKVITADKPGMIGNISVFLDKNKINVRKMTVEEDMREMENSRRMQVSLVIQLPKRNMLMTVAGDIQNLEGVSSVAVETI
jgi:putative Mg2+ transporter-C (MgtC) family protein